MGHIAEGGAGVGAAQLRKLLFADFMVPGAEPRQYMEVPSFERLTAVVGEYLADLNAGGLWAKRASWESRGLTSGTPRSA